MLRKIIPTSIGLTALMIVAVMVSLPSVDVAEKNPGLMAPPTSVFEITQLDEINTETPNKVESGDLLAGESAPVAVKEPNREFAKYQTIAKDIDALEMNVKILSNDDNSRTTILLSPNEITEKTTDYQFRYKDQGIWISLYSIENKNIPLDAFIANPNTGFTVVKVNDQYQAAIQSMGQVEQFGETVDRQLSLDMVTEDTQISIRGFISDDLAIKIANYLIG